jgi:glycerophosphoryl diester phosphodiesterase
MQEWATPAGPDPSGAAPPGRGAAAAGGEGAFAPLRLGGMAAAGVWHGMLDAPLLARLRRAGQMVVAWTVESADDRARLLGLGARGAERGSARPLRTAGHAAAPSCRLAGIVSPCLTRASNPQIPPTAGVDGVVVNDPAPAVRDVAALLTACMRQAHVLF